MESVTAQQPLTPELHAWIRDQRAAGHGNEALVGSMIASGWTDAAARRALKASRDLEDGAGVAVETAPEVPSVPVPDPLAGFEGGAVIRLADREVRILAAMKHPRVVVFGGLLSDDECDAMIAMARARLARSETVQTATGSNEVNAARTSEGMFFDRGEGELCTRIEARMAELMHWPVENGEGLQILRYGIGAEYRPHFDYFEPGDAGTPAILRRGGQRVASLVCYLNTPARGGATIFPDVGLDVAPVKGNAVFFSYDRPAAATLTLHGGAPVLEGEKWVATKWVREREFV
jgi:prolyl 4-hydroxylase